MVELAVLHTWLVTDESTDAGVEEANPHWSGKNTNRNVSLGGLGACLPGKFMP